MDRNEQYEFYKEYICSEKLDALINFKENIGYTERAFDAVGGQLKIPIPPQPGDLVNLHKLIRQRMCFTVLEFGVGYSTIVIADALKKNKADWKNNEQASKQEIRNRFMFRSFSVDASSEWIEHVKTHFPEGLLPHVTFHHSEVQIGLHNGQMCHFYKRLPDIVPDFIYLDGPSPKDVKGCINGLSFSCDERTVMSGDLLLMESTFLPGIFILVDGRTNNARFLQRNFTREYAVNQDKDADVTTFELKEERLGRFNVLGRDFFSDNR